MNSGLNHLYGIVNLYVSAYVSKKITTYDISCLSFQFYRSVRNDSNYWCISIKLYLQLLIEYFATEYTQLSIFTFDLFYRSFDTISNKKRKKKYYKSWIF